MLCRDIIEKFVIPSNSSVDIVFKSDLRDSFMIQTNCEELRKILNCLLSNACKFADGGTVVVKSLLNRSTKQVEISVTDKGEGIPEEDCEKIFNHFYKIDNYTEGIGLGLPLARRTARQLGGDVTLDTNYKDGARFVVTMPVE